ncbi:efflux RND transporter permease subunit [Leadbettera azotonutricia]|uniref:Mmpl family n=1 Tax=Leadbettera azotonutricia (strain ATCC BAA-888 / DSM 13862 / ZAS-9) TaxID=545695 RepID=F5Y9L7_LEAAZ|nr:efflux RND transporter permease subunit [Leadbettera azotonutricia]AEF83225.1 mmpl family [Leadbettera azotonutricia ZAS-9]
MEKSDEKFLDKFFKHPWPVVIVIGLLTVFFALQLPRAQLDNNNYRFVPSNDEARKVSTYIDDTFGSSSFVLVGLERKYGTVFDGEFINLIRKYIEQIEDIEIVGDINSIVSSDYIAGVGDSIVVEKLVPDDFSGTPGEIAQLKERILSWDMYKKSLISDDFTATQVLVPLEIDADDAGRPEVIDSFIRIRDIAREMFDGQAIVYVTGLPVISATINEAVRADLVLMVPLVILVVLLILFFSFRRLTPVILPLLTVLVAVIWSMGAMPLFDIKLSVISTVLPVILVAVGSAYGIHVVTHYIEDMSIKTGLNKDEHRELVVALLRKIGKAVFLAALTTFVGFSSFCFTSVLPIREFGYFSSFGVLASFIVAVTLIPSLLLIRGPKAIRNLSGNKKQADSSGSADSQDALSGLMADVFMAIARKRRFVIFITAVVALISVYGVSKVVIDNIFVEYFRSTTDISRSDRFIREKFGGSKIVSIVAQADSPEILLRPESLGAMDSLNAYLEQRVPEVGKVMGFTDLVKRINQVFNVDESPDGIKAQAPSSAGGDSFGFGFGGEEAGAADDFGFGDFGFDSPETETAAALRTDLSAEDLIALLEKAASSGDNRSLSGDELIRKLEKLLNYRGMSYYEIPTDPERYGKTSSEELQRLVANYLVLLSGNISSYSNDPLEPTAIKTTVQLRALGEADTNRAIGEINQFVKNEFPEDIKITVGGSALVEASLNRLVVQSQLSSVIISLLLVFLIIAISNHSVAAGIIGIAPLTISILINFAVMGFLGIKLNIGTSMVASVSVGIGIDYTIHYIEAYKREYRATGGTGDFLRRTFTTSGKAILINAVSVGAGFAVLILSQFNMLRDLGLLIALTMGTSALVSLTVIPVLLLFFKPKFIGVKL